MLTTCFLSPLAFLIVEALLFCADPLVLFLNNGSEVLEQASARGLQKTLNTKETYCFEDFCIHVSVEV